MALRLTSVFLAASESAPGREKSTLSSAKAAFAAISTGLQHLLGIGKDGLRAKQGQDSEEKGDSSKVCPRISDILSS
jgi:hypothetical protein